MTFQLNAEQVTTLDNLSAFEDIYVLKGYAGTGKTTVITRWIEAIRKKPGDWPKGKFWHAPSVVLTAPTNKATNVLKEMAKEIKLPVDVSTIHSLLSLKMKWEKAAQVLVKDTRGDDTFKDYDYVVIDEASMLDTDMMNKYILPAHEATGNKLIFMGDPCQLPPIGEKESESFDSSEDISELTQVMRQADDNPIQGLALYLRELILGRTSQYPIRIFEFVDDENIFHIPVANFEDQILEAFANDERASDIRHVAWTNRVVNSWNDKIRDKVYGFDREEWTEGERIVTTSPVIDQGEGGVVFSTDTLLKIQREPIQEDWKGIPCWKLWVKNKIIHVPVRGTDQLFNTIKDELLVAAKQDRKQWYKFYRFMEAFVHVKPAFSLTVHRSQGSTFDDVYVSYQNILTNPNRIESLQCLYVAITRPRGRLFLV